jgi:membrane-associated phospholipid phosphatase
VVAGSRVYVKIHHPSDVVAGALLGLVLARVVRQVWPFP